MSVSDNKVMRTGAKASRPGNRLEMRVGEEVDTSNVMFHFLRENWIGRVLGVTDTMTITQWLELVRG